MIPLVLALTLALPSHHAAPSLPQHGVLVPGKSLAGVGLGDTARSVRARWGGPDEVCGSCAIQTWYYAAPSRAPEPLGVGVSFRGDRVTAVFTLGAPRGWRTSEGLLLGEGIGEVTRLYGSVAWKECVGYMALSVRRGSVVTSIYATGESVYGFALTRPNEPICQ